MEQNRQSRFQALVQHWLFTLFTALITCSPTSRRVSAEWDVTRSERSTLSPATLDVLKQLDGPLTITAYAASRDAGGHDLQKAVTERLRPYLRAKTDITLALVDPREEPKKAVAAGIRTPNELIVEHRKRSEHLPIEDFNEQNFANLLMRLARGADGLLMWLDGHGERKLTGIANRSGEFGRRCSEGFPPGEPQLAVAQDVRNIAVRGATPQVDLWARDQQDHALPRSRHNLLWLIDRNRCAASNRSRRCWD
jgi:hypothetical protein